MLVDQAREQYESGYVHWPAKLVLELDNLHAGLALTWAIECAEALVENVGPDNKDQLLRWLAELSKSQDNPDSDELMVQADKIWHEERTILNTAISHLYAALSRRAEGDGNKYRWSLNASLRVMGGHEFHQQSPLEIPFKLFERFTNNSQL
ncbi:MAG: hypothetical protein N2C14_10125 [Planctomycetales bacterium]